MYTKEIANSSNEFKNIRLKSPVNPAEKYDRLDKFFKYKKEVPKEERKKRNKLTILD